MTSLTVEMGLRRRRGDSPPLPDEIAGRDDMTLAQKQRLAVLAKMGVGPIAPPAERPAPRTEIKESIGGPPPVDRRAILLERERRMREQEEKQREEEEKLLEEKRKKKVVKFSGISRLGPVMPREDDIPQFLPAPAQEPEPRRYRDAALDRAKANEPAEEDDTENEQEAGQKPSAPSKQDRKRTAQEDQQRLLKQQQQQQQGPRRKKKKKAQDNGWEDWQGDEDDWDEEDGPEELPPPAPLPLPQPRKRDGGISKQTMVVESVKGKVSHANKNLTDADLERRFPMHDSAGGSGSLMTEAEVLRLIRKERKEKGSSTGSAARRVQRELAEWENAKEVQRARVKSPHRFERMVVARK
mmetsp:Transcript_98434/g.293948  ORF Transcript_98434/g.293948 Transcript_98434/m.293948 type:complete len:355 (-) Transcript_98434:91-1155(-)|eukprot:CAMPEP_0175215832 /NCGR_PEP_ID=MMETSP0093-20121207/17418_1 /TAXON_ID=311494 /ORGANISM="Alexandrium monilatum, Strain CCMP3105" /LENGTH=354 /DNA_ID=CAMNT_0016509213 /DNA_START=69 /DNA_END=1133 /DNA_ORIENTATION=-